MEEPQMSKAENTFKQEQKPHQVTSSSLFILTCVYPLVIFWPVKAQQCAQLYG